jgi:hypothetical protein
LLTVLPVTGDHERVIDAGLEETEVHRATAFSVLAFEGRVAGLQADVVGGGGGTVSEATLNVLA